MFTIAKDATDMAPDGCQDI